MNGIGALLIQISIFTAIAFASGTREPNLPVLISGLHSSRTKPIGTFFPHGASPESVNASDANPRVVIPLSGDPYEARRKFFAYSKQDRLFQAIIFRPKPPGYVFMEDRDFDGTQPPRLQPVKDVGECYVCHQSKGPTFPHASWNQMNEQDRNFGDPSVISRIKNAMPQGSVTYAGFPLDNVNGISVSMNVMNGNRHLQAARACAQVCGNDIQCRGDLIKLAITNAKPAVRLNQSEVSTVFTFFAPKAEKLNRLSSFPPPSDGLEEKILANWPEDGFEYRDWGFRDVPRGNVSSDSSRASAQRSMIGRIPKDKALSYIQEVAFDCLDFHPSDAKLFNELGPEKIKKAFASTLMQDLLKDWPPTRESLLKALYLGSETALPSTFQGDCPDPIQGAQPVPKAEVAALTTLGHQLKQESARPISVEHFRVFCGSCHNPTSKNKKHRFPLNDSLLFETYLKENVGKISRALEDKRMPPEGEVNILPSDALRKDMVSWLRGEANK